MSEEGLSEVGEGEVAEHVTYSTSAVTTQWTTGEVMQEYE